MVLVNTSKRYFKKGRTEETYPTKIPAIYSSIEKGFPVDQANEEPADAKGIGAPIDLFLIEKLSPNVTPQNEGDREDRKDHCMLKGSSHLCRFDHQKCANPVGDASEKSIVDLSLSGELPFTAEIDPCLDQCS